VSELVGLETALDLDRYVVYYENRANRGTLADHARRDRHQPRTDDSQGGCLARKNASLEKGEQEPTKKRRRQDVLESEEPTSVEIESLAVHEEVLEEDAAMKTVRAL
jgi:hypothetical protein